MEITTEQTSKPIINNKCFEKVNSILFINLIIRVLLQERFRFCGHRVFAVRAQKTLATGEMQQSLMEKEDLDSIWSVPDS